MDRGYLSNLLFPCPKVAPLEIWATLWPRGFKGEVVRNSQHISHTNVWVMHTNALQGSKRLRHKKVKHQCMTIILAALVDHPSPMICAKIQPQRRFSKVFTIHGHGGHLSQWTTTILAIFCSPNLRRLHMKFEKNWHEKLFVIVTRRSHKQMTDKKWSL